MVNDPQRPVVQTVETSIAEPQAVVQITSDLGAALRRYAPWAFAFVALALFVLLFSSVLTPFVAGIALGYLLDPVANRLEKAGMNRLGAALFILGVFVLLLGVGLFIIVPILSHQLANFVDAAPQILARLQKLLTESSGRFVDSWAGELLQKYGVTPSGDSSGDAQKWAGDLVSSAVGWAGGLLKSMLSGGAALFSVLSLLVVTPVVAFYILVDWNKMRATVQSLIPPRLLPEATMLAGNIDRALAGFVRGQSLVCLLLGLWLGLGLSLIGLNFGFLIGITAGVLSFIPYVGSLTALVVSAIVAIVQDWPNWSLLIKAMAVVGVGQFLEGNFLSPKLVGESVGVHPVWLMFALLAGGALLGFTGLIIAAPVAATIGVLLRHALARYRTSPFYLSGSTAVAPAATIVVEHKGK